MRAPSREPTLDEKVTLLERPAAYPDGAERVETIETHMSLVFLTDRYVYKLKKPIRYDVLDFSTVEQRRRSCRREVRLNRRMAPDVYLGVVPLTLDPRDGLRLDGAGAPVDWLVKMRRLPADRMLDHLIVAGAVVEEDVQPAAELLAAFYARAAPAPVDGPAYRRHLREGIEADRDELVKSEYGLPADDVREIASAQLSYLEREWETLERRVSSGRVVEGHGDLRPQHICLTDPPVVIDCLEFSRDLRIQDPLHELSLLWLESDRLGAAQVGRWFVDVYLRKSEDHAPSDLMRFYWRARALRRAKVSMWHQRDSGHDHFEKWRKRARWYIGAAERAPRAG